MTIITDEYKALVQARINAATPATTLASLAALRAQAAGLGCDETNLDTLLSTVVAGFNDNTPDIDLILARKADNGAGSSGPAGSSSVPVGSVVEFPVGIPKKIKNSSGSFMAFGEIEDDPAEFDVEYWQQMLHSFWIENPHDTDLNNFTAVSATASANRILVVGYSGSSALAFVSDDVGANFVSIAPNLGNHPYFSEYINGAFYVSDSSGRLVRSATATSGSFAIVLPSSASRLVMAMANKGDVVIAVGLATTNTPAIYRSTDNGITFSAAISYPEAFSGAFNDVFYDDVTDAFYAVTTNGRLYVSKDNGQSWAKIYTSSRSASLTSIGRAGSQLFIAEGNNFIHLSEGGDSWVDRGSINIHGLSFRPGRYFVASDGSLIAFASNNVTIYKTFDFTKFEKLYTAPAAINSVVKASSAIAILPTLPTVLNPSVRGFDIPVAGVPYRSTAQDVTKTVRIK
jgi:hypothetical protein